MSKFMGRQKVPLKYSLGTTGIQSVVETFRPVGSREGWPERVWKVSLRKALMGGFAWETVGVNGRVLCGEPYPRWEKEWTKHCFTWSFISLRMPSSQAQCFVPRTQVNEAVQCHSSDHGPWVRRTRVRVPVLLPSSCVILVKRFNLWDLLFHSVKWGDDNGTSSGGHCED